MKTLTVNLGDRSYPIFIGKGLLGQAELVLPHVHGEQVMVVTNKTIAPLYLKKTLDMFRSHQCHHLILPDGEVYKNLEVLNQLFDELLLNKCDRNTTLVALGGGVIGDLTGFAAACYQRGVPFIQIPTTLLAQVDSSVGGKTGVNHAQGKNMIGAFHQPNCVIADTDTLDTLDDRELSAGLAEVIKYGLLGNLEFVHWLEDNMNDLLARNPQALAFAIEVSCREKAAIVAEDEREHGKRALLNLGHTFGHAIETGVGYGKWLHGEAVGTGMLMAADLSHRLGWITDKDLHRVDNLIDRAQLPTRSPASLDEHKFFELMTRDKKAKAGHIRLVLLKKMGQAVLCDDYDDALLQQTLRDHHAIAKQYGLRV